MHNVADHADTNRETTLDGVAVNLTSSSYLGSSTLTVLGSQQLRPATPGLTDTWARFTVRLHDGYANGPAGQPTEIDGCYQLDYNYYGLSSTENLSC
jgi:hypothetical protein